MSDISAHTAESNSDRMTGGLRQTFLRWATRGDGWHKILSQWHLVWFVLLILSLIGSAIVVSHLWEVLQTLLQGTLDHDALVYFPVGRGILNGLRPYEELFDTKPPGTYFFAALSLLITGNGLLLSILGIAALVCLPLSLVWFAYRSSSEAEWSLGRAVQLSTALLIGLLITKYLDQRAAGLDTYFFAAIAACGYAYAIIHPPSSSLKWNIALWSGLLFISASMIEPFIVSSAAVAALLATDLKTFLRTFIIPALIAGIVGLCVLALTGILDPYLSVYFPIMAFKRANVPAKLPLWTLVFDIYPFYKDMTGNYPASPLFGNLIAILYAWSPNVLAQKHTDSRRFLLLLTMLFALLWMLFAGMIITGSWVILNVQANTSIAQLMTRHVPLFFPVTILLSVLLWLQWGKQTMLRPLISLLVLCPVIVFVILAGGSGNHFSFVVPLYYAAALLFFHSMATRRDDAALLLMTGLALLVAFTSHMPQQYREYLKSTTVNMEETWAAPVRELDSLLDACGIERYYSPNYLAFAFSRHSPWGPIFTGNAKWLYSFIPENHPLMIESFVHIIKDVDIFVSSLPLGMPIYEDILKDLYTSEAPPCAAPFLPLGKYQVWFKKGKVFTHL